MSIDLILGTAGHIDHGKTTLIRCLTGTNTDRLPEEKRRGITIELGFAELDLGDYRLGIVDVPGHERFVRQMLAGATGMDVALLVVAADDSVKPQTREHLDVLRLLDLKAGVIALTKSDMASPDWIALVEDEVRELVQGSFLSDAPMIRTSAPLNQGLDELRGALREAAAHAAPAAAARLQVPFRMAIDRSFTMTGHGTVVTGSVSTGQVALGDRLLVMPGEIDVRVRGLHNHDREVPQISRGQRAAINLAGIHHAQLRRGHELVAPGYLVPSRRLTSQITLLPSAPRPLKVRDRVRLHVGTAEVLASVAPLGTERIAPGQTVVAQLYLTEPVVTSWNQPFVLRSESPVTTIAGGRVLVPVAGKLRRPSDAVLQRLDDLMSADPLVRTSAAIYFNGHDIQGPIDLARVAGVGSGHPNLTDLVRRGELVELTLSGHRRVYLHARRLDEYAERIATVLSQWHDLHPLKSGFDRTKLIQQFGDLGDASIVELVLTRMVHQGQLRGADRLVGLADRGPQLSRGEQELLRQLIERFQAAGFQPPSIKECEGSTVKNQKSVRSLLALAVCNGDLVEIGDGLYLHAATEQELRRRLEDAFSRQPQLTMSEMREILGTSRKYGVPIGEYLDRIGFTRRQGDFRQLGSANAGAPVGHRFS